MNTHMETSRSISAWTKRTTRFLRWTFTICLAVVVPVAAQAAIFNIPDGDMAGLIAAINTANGNGQADAINLASGGTYTLTAVNNSGYYGATGLPVITSPITITGNGATIQRSSAVGTPDFRMFIVSSAPAYLTLDGVTVRGGTAPSWGGGALLNTGGALLKNSTLAENSGGLGGAIFNYCGALTLLNSTISHNTSFSGYGGGGILNLSSYCQSTTAVINSTVFENRAAGPIGGRGDSIADAFSGPGWIVVKNSILASPNRGLGNEFYVAAGVVASLGHNIVADTSGGLTGPGDLNNTNPLLAALASNGGPTQTHAPLSGSPAINGVPIANCTDASGIPITTDQRGFPRPQGLACDIGSVEFSGVFAPVPSDTDKDPGVPLSATGGLSGSVVYANAEPFAGTLDSDLAGTLRTMVVDRGGGLFDFYYQITNASSVVALGGSDIFRVAVGGYEEASVEVSAAYTASIAGVTGAPAAFHTSTPTAGKTVRSADRDPALRNAQGVSLSALCFHNENIEAPFYLRSLYLTYGATQGSCAPIDPAPPLLNDAPPPPEAFTLGGVGFTFDATGVFNTNYEGPVTSAANNIEVGETSHWLVVRTNRTTYAHVVAHISAGDGTAIVATMAPLGGPDGTPPETTITGGPVGTVSGNIAIFTFTGSDNLTLPAGLTFEASLDGAAFAPVVSPKTCTGLSAGPHTFAIRAPRLAVASRI